MKLYKYIYVAALLMLCSCIKEGYDRDNCPGEYQIVPLLPDETTGDEQTEDVTIIIIDKDGKEEILNGGTGNDNGNGSGVDLEDGDYTVVVVTGTTGSAEKPSGVITDGTTIKVEVDEDGTLKDAGLGIMGGYAGVTVGDGGITGGGTTGGGTTGGDSGTNIQIPVFQQTRPLVINLKFEGENTSLLQGVIGVLGGIALERDLNNGFAPVDGTRRPAAISSGSVNYDFAQVAGEDGSYTQTRVLIGIDGNGNQILTLQVTYTDGTQKEYVFDVTSAMDGFHTEDVTKPWVINLVIRLGADFTATIVDWKVGPDSYMDAH